MDRRRVVVTGLGMVSPVGNNLATGWDNILNGVSGVELITRFDASAFASQMAGEVKDFDVTNYLAAKDAKKVDVFIHYAFAAAQQALAHSGLELSDEQSLRAGVSFGVGMGGLPSIEKTTETYLNKGSRRISPFYIPSVITNMASGYISMFNNLRGPNVCLSTACASSTHSIGYAARTIAWGDADIMVAGGAEAAISPTGIGGFCAAKALSTRNDDPAAASRPWDKNRDGFVFGEGGGAMVLESLEHAQQRGATILAELTGFGMSADAYHVTMPSPGGDGAMRCMQAALNDAMLNTQDIQYINAHGTSTPVGDKSECDAVRSCFAEHADHLAMSSTKSMTGHLLGAAGAIEAIFSVLALRDQVAPPTINLTDPDPDCDLDFVPNTAREMPLTAVLSNSFGFGGTNASLIFSRYS